MQVFLVTVVISYSRMLCRSIVVCQQPAANTFYVSLKFKSVCISVSVAFLILVDFHIYSLNHILPFLLFMLQHIKKAFYARTIFHNQKKTGLKFPNSQTSDCTVGNNLIIILILTHLIFSIILVNTQRAIVSFCREDILLLMI